MQFYIADVINNVDSDQAGKIQIYCEPLHHSFIPSEYPWARSATNGGGGSSTSGISFIPEIGSKVWIFFEDEQNWRNPFYIADVHLTTNNPHLLYETTVKGIIGANGTYPNVKFFYMPNGTCLALNSVENEITIYNNANTYIFLDSTGNVTIKGTKINMYNPLSTAWKPCVLPTCPLLGVQIGDDGQGTLTGIVTTES